MGKFLGLVHIHRSTFKLAGEDQKTQAILKVEGGCHDVTYPREYAQNHVLLRRNKGSTLFADGDTSNAIVTYNFWLEHGLILLI